MVWWKRIRDLKGGGRQVNTEAFAQPMSRAQLAEFAPMFELPYTADSMRAPLRQLGLTPLFERAEPGTKTTRVAHYDPVVLWVLALAFYSPKPWRPKTVSAKSVEPAPSLRSLLEEYERRAESMAFVEFMGGYPKNPEWTWKRVSYWRLLVDRDYGLDLRLLDRIVGRLPESTQFEMGSYSVLPLLLQQYKEALLRYLGTKIGGSDGTSFESWDLVDEVLESARVTVPQEQQTEAASQQMVIQRRS